MREKESKNFLYQINFNRVKYPEICKELEEQKDKEGIAWYLRQLITKDIEEKKARQEEEERQKEVDYKFERTKRVPIKKDLYSSKPDSISDLPDDNGGFI